MSAYIKPEFIKPDPDAPGASPAPFADEDIYEDTGDLEFNEDPSYKKLYLARVPKYLWEAWSELDDDAEIQIGTVRMSTRPEADGTNRTALHMLLSSQIAAHQTIPKEYHLDVTEQSVKNTFVFTEQDLPGFRSKSRTTFDSASANMPARLKNQQKYLQNADKPRIKDKDKKPYERKAIPKKTCIAGTIKHEVNCIAVDNEETNRILAERTLEAMRPKKHTKYIDEDVNGLSAGYIQAGSLGAVSSFSSFIKTAGPKSNKQSQEAKTARMPQNELLDAIFNCFRQYNYWPMKALRAELKQPEAYIRETLEKVADLAKSGRFAMNWTLKPEYKLANYEGTGDAIAPSAIGADGAEESDGDDAEEDDEEDMKMEDVMPQ